MSSVLVVVLLGLFPIKHFQEKFFHIDRSNDRLKEEPRNDVCVDGPKHGEGDEEFGESRGVPSVNHFDIFIKCLVCFALQPLYVMLTLQPFNVYRKKN